MIKRKTGNQKKDTGLPLSKDFFTYNTDLIVYMHNFASKISFQWPQSLSSKPLRRYAVLP